LQLPRRREEREDEVGIATEVSEARLHQRRGKNTPTLMTPGREAIEHEIRAE